MKRDWHILIALILTVSIGTGGVFFAFPKKAEANVLECLSGILFAKTEGEVDIDEAEFSGFGQTVPVNDDAVKAMDRANANINANTSGQAQGATVTRCVVEPLVTTMVRSLLNTFTAQTINWINGGFKGSPLYVTNPQGFLTDIADQSLGQFINSLGPIGQIVCSPFDLQLRLSLNLQFNTGLGNDYYQEVGCRLTDIQKNVQRAFTGGVFGQNGWDSWLQTIAQPQNNPYGAYIKAVDSLDVTIAGRQSINLKQLDWGNGFLSSTDPETGDVSTPGSLIEDQLSTTLGVEVQRVGLAKDIDAILGALVNQLVNQVLGPGGLLGASKKPSGGQRPTTVGQAPASAGLSPVERALSMTPGAIIAGNEAAQKLPDGLYMNSATVATGNDKDGKPLVAPESFCSDFKNNLYSADKSTTGGILTNTTPVVVKINGTGGNVATRKVGGGQWTLDEYNRVATFCKSVNETAPINAASRSFNEQTMGNGQNSPKSQPKAPVNENIARGKPARQSSDWVQSVHGSAIASYPASRAVKGTATGVLLGGSVTNDATNNWWTVDLGQVYKIYKIDVYEFIGRPFSGCVIVSKNEFGSSALPCTTASNTFPLPSPTVIPTTISAGGIEGRYVWIQQIAPRDNMILDEVQVFSAPQAAGADTSGADISFSPIAQESRPNSENYYNTAYKDFLSEFRMTANQSQTGLKARLKLLATTADGTDQTPQFSSIFAPDSFAINGLPLDVSKNSVTFNENFSLTKGQTVLYKETARIADNPIFTSTVSYLSYKIVMEFFKVVGGREEVVAAQTTTFKIQ